ncbi:MAG: cobyric acid synthase [Dehalococcoidia bacterium]
MKARSLMIQGTASSVGKSIFVTALCRMLRQDGYRVAPFKAQNMALNSFVTPQGGEIGRSQAIQAEAAGIAPSVHMNPVLLKPQADATSQLILRGHARRVSDAADYYRQSLDLLPIIEESFNGLCAEYEIIIIEGAGSPAEINLMDREIVNMRIAGMAGAPVILVGDIDRGGVFASIAGTMQLLPRRQRHHIKGFAINKFRGDISLLKPGVDFLEKRYSRPVLGVIPYIRDMGIAQEDSVYLDERSNAENRGRPYICIIRLPHIANYDDFDPLKALCNVRYVSSPYELGQPDLIILPGTKATINDLIHLDSIGMSDEIRHMAQAGIPIVGICGGYQMLGNKIIDPHHAESDTTETPGLGLLDMETVFEIEKITTQVKAGVSGSAGLLQGMDSVRVNAYEIHMGRTQSFSAQPAFLVTQSVISDKPYSEGGLNKTGTIFGSYMHGLFDNRDFTCTLLDNLCRLRGIPPVKKHWPDREKAYDNLASIFRENLDMQGIYKIIEGGANG